MTASKMINLNSSGKRFLLREEPLLHLLASALTEHHEIQQPSPVNGGFYTAIEHRLIGSNAACNRRLSPFGTGETLQ